jgi:periplasmic protein TonB
VFRRPVINAMMQYGCISGSGDIIATQEFVFRIE